KQFLIDNYTDYVADGHNVVATVVIRAATANATCSWNGRATTCTPIGKPLRDNHIGTTTDGSPSMLTARKLASASIQSRLWPPTSKLSTPIDGARTDATGRISTSPVSLRNSSISTARSAHRASTSALVLSYTAASIAAVSGS